MALYNFHRVLIAATIMFDVAFTLYCLRNFQEGGGWLQLAMGAVSTLVTIGFVAYLIHFNRKVTLLRVLIEQREAEG